MDSPGAMRCPLCNEVVTSVATRPFCSDRCRSADLGRWLDGSYRIAGDPVDPAVELDREVFPDCAASSDGAKESTCD